MISFINDPNELKGRRELTPSSGAMIHYSSAKAAMNAWSKTLATE